MARRALAMLALGLPATVHAATTCASLACMEDLDALTDADLNALSEEAVKNSCVQYSTDAEACVKAYMTRTDGTYSPCEYSLYDENSDPPGEPR